jgi:putative DNA primase/helicase
MAVRQAAAEYRSDMDLVGQWIEERCRHDAAAFTPKGAAYNDYVAWTRTEQYPTLGSRKFGEELDSRGFARQKSNGVRGYKGLQVKTMSTDAASTRLRPRSRALA